MLKEHLELFHKAEQAKKLLDEVVEEMRKKECRLDTYWRVLKAKGHLYIALKYWGD